MGTVTGVIAGLATVTPASGYVGPAGGLIVSAVAGVVYFFAIDIVKERWKIDDSLDVFAVHGVGGMIGLLVAFLAVAVLGGNGLTVESGAIGSQLGVQALGVVVAVAWAAVLTLIIVKVANRRPEG